MLASTLCRLLSVACLGLHAVQLCWAVDIHHEQAEQTMTHCLKNCSQLTRDLIERKLNPKITSRQSCYEECLRKFGKQDFHGNRQVKLLSKRIKRDASNIPANPKQGNTTACEDAGDGKYRAIDKKNITVTFHKFGKTDRFYAKISWTPPPESANWTGYKLIYITGKLNGWDYNCKHLKKTNTSYIVINSSYGLEEDDYFRVKVLSLPQIHGVKVDYIQKKVGLTIKPTDKVTPSITGNIGSCEDAGDEKYRAIDKKNVTLTFHKLGKTDRFYAKISWSPPPESANWTGYKLIYVTGRGWVYNCKNLKKTSTSYIMNNSSYGLKKDDIFRVKVLSLPQIDGVYVDYIRKKVKPTDNVTPSITDAVNQGTTSSSPRNPTPSSISDKENNFLTSPFSDNKTSPKKVVIPIASVSITIGVAVVVYWYFRRSSKTKGQLGSGVTGIVEVEFDAYIIYSSADQKWVTCTLLPLLEERHGLKCCVHYRDFIIGKPFRENMADCVYKSRKTVAVVSRSFFNSKYCNSEMDMALGRLLERGDESVVVIKLDDVDRKKLPKALKERSYIDYSKSTEKETWEKKLVDCLKVPINHASSDNFV